MPEKLLIVSGPLEGRSFLLDPATDWMVGRGKNNPIWVPLDPCLSTRHARLRTVDHKIIVTDLNSSNGSFIEGKKLSPSLEYSFRDFLVLGSTIFKKDTHSGLKADLDAGPESEFTADEKKSQSFIRVALRLAEEAKKQYIDAACLLFAFFEENPEVMHQICSDFMLDPEFLKARWFKDHFFDVPFTWLNDFISISHKQSLGNAPLFSPLARNILRQFSRLEDLSNPIPKMKVFFLLPFNLIYPLLDWEKTRVRWTYTLEKMARPKKSVATVPPPPKPAQKSVVTSPKPTASFQPGQSTLPELILPDSFWGDFSASLQKSQQHVFLGHKGSGKSSILHRIFFPSNPLYPEFSKRILYDSKVFLILNSEKKLQRFTQSIIRDLGSKDLVGVDHIDHLLMNLQNNGIERGPLIQALKKPSSKVLIALDMENRSMVSGLLNSPHIHYLGNYLDQVRDQIYIKLLREFEVRVHCFLSSAAREFIKEVVIDPSPDNISAIKDFLDFAYRKAGNIDFPFHELATQTLASGQLGKAYFMDIYSDWVGLSRGQQQAKTQSPDEEDPFRLFAFQLEELVQAFSKNALKIGLHYSDQTSSLKDFRNLSTDEKLLQLKSQIVCLLTAYQHGFQRWFPTLWRGIDPDELKKQSNNVRKLWQMFEERADLIDEAYAEDQFNESTSRVFQEIYRI